MSAPPPTKSKFKFLALVEGEQHELGHLGVVVWTEKELACSSGRERQGASMRWSV